VATGIIVQCVVRNHLGDMMNEVGKIIWSLWIAMYLAVFISFIFNVDIIISRAFYTGIITFVLTILYVIYGWYREDKIEKPHN